MTEVHHATVFFTGRVQGVGFRYSALQVALGFEVNGQVRNSPGFPNVWRVSRGQSEVAIRRAVWNSPVSLPSG